MIKKDVVQDLQTLTTISKSALNKLVSIVEMVICNDVEELSSTSDNIVSLNIGIGNILLQIEEGQVRYKFVPSKRLEEGIRKTYLEGKNPLTQAIEQSLIKKITDVYKELL